MIETLKVNTTLTSLELGSEGKEQLRKRRKRKKRVTDNAFGVEGATTLSEMIKMNTTLTSLDLWSKKKE